MLNTRVEYIFQLKRVSTLLIQKNHSPRRIHIVPTTPTKALFYLMKTNKTKFILLEDYNTNLLTFKKMWRLNKTAPTIV